MKIVIAHNYDSFSYARNSVALAKKLANAGHQVFFISHQPALNHAFDPLPTLQVISWPQKRPSGLGAILFAVKKLQSIKPDVVLAHSAAVNPILMASYLLKIPGRIAYYHSAYEASLLDISRNRLINRFLNWRKSKIYKLATSIIAVSNFAANDLSKHFKIPAERIHIIYNALPPAKMARQRPREQKSVQEEVLFCYVGRLDKGKGISMLLSSFLAANEGKNMKLLIAGSGSEQQEIIKATITNSYIDYAGVLNYDHVPDFISSVDFLLYPTKAEAFGMVLIEAMAAQTIPIASKVGGIPEIIKDGENGFLVPGILGDTWDEAIKNAAALKKDLPAYVRVTNKGLATISKHYTQEKQVALLTEIILSENNHI